MPTSRRSRTTISPTPSVSFAVKNLHAIGGTETALFHEHPDADADQFACGLAFFDVRVQLGPTDLRKQLVVRSVDAALGNGT